MAHQFIQFNKNCNRHPLSLERVKVCRCTVSMGFRTGIHLINPAELCMCVQNTTQTEEMRLLWFHTQGPWPR